MRVSMKVAIYKHFLPIVCFLCATWPPILNRCSSDTKSEWVDSTDIGQEENRLSDEDALEASDWTPPADYLDVVDLTPVEAKDQEVFHDSETDASSTTWCASPGGFGCQCEDNNDCVSGYCVDWSEGKICTQTCVTECPEGFACLQDTQTTTDIKFVCVPVNVYLCRPCNSSDECHASFIDANDLCIPHGTNGSFCAVDCSGGKECPQGYVCGEFEWEGGQTVYQCVPEGGECQCTPKFVKEGAWTKCVKQNGFGTCEGKRICSIDGLTDCDAQTPAIESCNGKDDNCDGVTDPTDSQGCIPYFKDEDGDGYGIGIGICECQPPGPQYTTLGGDCNDSNVGVNPSIPEACNKIDDDCDGQTDEMNADGCQVMYFDGDGDGHGDPTVTGCMCEETDEYKKLGDDCDDSNPDVFPTHQEICDGIDNNCDGVIDEENAEGCTPYYLDQDKDGYGLSDYLKCLCDKIGEFTAIKGGDCDDLDYNIHPLVVELCDGKDNDCDGDIDEDEAVLSCGDVPHGEVACIEGTCKVIACDQGYFDLNFQYLDGCECPVEPTEVPDQTCTTATSAGVYTDQGQSGTVTGKIVPQGDEDWYVIEAQDTEIGPNHAEKDNCDTFHVRIKFLKNPNEAYVFDVYKGGCGEALNLCKEGTEFEDFVDFHSPVKDADKGGGECPCKPDTKSAKITPNDYSDDTDDGSHQCENHTSLYYIRVYRKPGVAPVCDNYQLEFSNGVNPQ